jgi:hypothetical protein
MEPIEVTARFDVQGNITPLNFSWKGGIYQVESTGKRWQDVQGMHFLVMISGEKIYELTYQSGEGRWFIDQPGPRRMFV